MMCIFALEYNSTDDRYQQSDAMQRNSIKNWYHLSLTLCDILRIKLGIKTV
jgi:hypothetical protein